MSNQSQEASIYRVSTKQFLGGLFAVIFTLGGIIVSGSYYIVSNIISSVDVVRADTDSNTVAIHSLVRDAKECAKLHETLGNRIATHLILSEAIHDQCSIDITRLMERRDADRDLLNDCMRRLQ